MQLKQSVAEHLHSANSPILRRRYAEAGAAMAAFKRNNPLVSLLDGQTECGVPACAHTAVAIDHGHQKTVEFSDAFRLSGGRLRSKRDFEAGLRDLEAGALQVCDFHHGRVTAAENRARAAWKAGLPVPLPKLSDLWAKAPTPTRFF